MPHKSWERISRERFEAAMCSRYETHLALSDPRATLLKHHDAVEGHYSITASGAGAGSIKVGADPGRNLGLLAEFAVGGVNGLMRLRRGGEEEQKEEEEVEVVMQNGKRRRCGEEEQGREKRVKGENKEKDAKFLGRWRGVDEVGEMVEGEGVLAFTEGGVSGSMGKLQVEGWKLEEGKRITIRKRWRDLEPVKSGAE